MLLAFFALTQRQRKRLLRLARVSFDANCPESCRLLSSLNRIVVVAIKTQCLRFSLSRHFILGGSEMEI
jgi:hypothetical protein